MATVGWVEGCQICHYESLHCEDRHGEGRRECCLCGYFYESHFAERLRGLAAWALVKRVFHPDDPSTSLDTWSLGSWAWREGFLPKTAESFGKLGVVDTWFGASGAPVGDTIWCSGRNAIGVDSVRAARCTLVAELFRETRLQPTTWLPDHHSLY